MHNSVWVGCFQEKWIMYAVNEVSPVLLVELLGCWKCDFESWWGRGCWSIVFVLCYIGRGVCYEPITRSGESYRVCVCVCLIACYLETSRNSCGLDQSCAVGQQRIKRTNITVYWYVTNLQAHIFQFIITFSYAILYLHLS
jgi:hypothetical protein